MVAQLVHQDGFREPRIPCEIKQELGVVMTFECLHYMFTCYATLMCMPDHKVLDGCFAL